jgi:hypothetical protein
MDHTQSTRAQGEEYPEHVRSWYVPDASLDIIREASDKVLKIAKWKPSYIYIFLENPAGLPSAVNETDKEYILNLVGIAIQIAAHRSTQHSHFLVLLNTIQTYPEALVCIHNEEKGTYEHMYALGLGEKIIRELSLKGMVAALSGDTSKIASEEIVKGQLMSTAAILPPDPTLITDKSVPGKRSSTQEAQSDELSNKLENTKI